MSTTVKMGFWEWTGAMNSNGLYTSAEMQYLVFDAADEDAALSAAFAEIPKTFNGLHLDSISYDERINETNHVVKAAYKGANSISTTDRDTGSFSFDTSGGTQHLTQSLETMARYPSTAPDLKGAIGYDGETVNGVDIVRPALTFTESRIFDEVSTSYKKKLAALTGKVNSTSFKGFEPGEVLFRGASASGKIGEPVEITYRFSYSENKTDYMVGSITVAEDKGWDYAWVTYEDDVDTAAKSLVKKPSAVYVERVCELSDFGALGLGG